MVISKNGISSILGGISKADNQLSKSFAKLSSGSRITKAADDAAGLSIAAKLDAIVAQLGQANRNSGDGRSAINIAEAAAGQITDINIRRQELAIQASNGVLSDDQRATLNAEFQALGEEVDRITATTEFNGKQLLSGGDITIQAGIGSDANSQVTVENVNIDTSTTSSLSIATQAGALAAIEPLTNFSADVTRLRGNLGAADKRLEVNISNNEQSIVNSRAAESRIRDVDFATETSNLVANRILRDASTALLAQANVSRQSALRLLG